MSASETSVPPLSLRPWPTGKHEEDATRKFQERLFRERGHFRHITEEALEEEISKVQLGVPEEVTDDEDETGQDYKKRAEELAGTKNEITAHIAQAHNQAMIMRDFIALLVSRDNPKAGAQSMSPAMAKDVPSGSMAVERWEMPEPSAAQKENERLIAQGAKLESFSNAADRLLSAATRLESEVRKETAYWGQILCVKEKGWSIRRIPRVDPTTYGVQVGFAEAGAQFKRRGFIALRADADGSVILDREQRVAPKAVRVRVCHHGEVAGTSRLHLLPSANNETIEESIRHARDALFEEELFHEMSLEARILLSYNVGFRDNVIRLPAYDAAKDEDIEREILVDMVELDDHALTPKGPMDSLAQAIALALRLLLCYVHRQRFRRRTELPAPLSNRKQEKPPEAILRPVMTFFRHQEDVARVRNFCTELSRVLQSANLPANLTVNTDIQLSELQKDVSSDTNSSSLFESLVTALIRPLKTSILIPVPSSRPSDPVQVSLAVEIRTLMYAPVYGTEFSLTLPSQVTPLIFTPVKVLQGSNCSAPQPSGTTKRFTFSTASDLTSYISRLIALDVSHNIIAKENEGWSAGDRAPEVTWSTRDDDMKQRMMRVDIDKADDDGPIAVRLRLRGKKMENERTGKIDEEIWDGSEGKKGFREAVSGLVKAYRV